MLQHQPTCAENHVLVMMLPSNSARAPIFISKPFLATGQPKPATVVVLPFQVSGLKKLLRRTSMSVGTSRLQFTVTVQPVGVSAGLPPPPRRIPSPDASQWLFTNLYTPQPEL